MVIPGNFIAVACELVIICSVIVKRAVLHY